MKKLLFIALFFFLFSFSFAASKNYDPIDPTPYRDCLNANNNHFSECMPLQCKGDYIYCSSVDLGMKQLIHLGKPVPSTYYEQYDKNCANFAYCLDYYGQLNNSNDNTNDDNSGPDSNSDDAVKEQLKKDYWECIFALMVYKHTTLYATTDQGQIQAKYYDDITGQPWYAVPKWLWRSGCANDYVTVPVDICLAQHCNNNYKAPLEQMGGSISKAQYDIKPGSYVEKLDDTAIKIDYGSVHTYTPGTTIIMPNGGVYQQSEVIANVYEDGSSDVYLIEGKAYYVSFSGKQNTEIALNLLYPISANGDLNEPVPLNENQLDKWWENDGFNFDWDNSTLCSPILISLVALLGIIRCV
ncbi:MAG: hypothetical protein WC501_05090 [Candidatus Micrarchaeia archaeon]